MSARVFAPQHATCEIRSETVTGTVLARGSWQPAEQLLNIQGGEGGGVLVANRLILQHVL